jgi:tripartite ATP-independent transporter DctM subunit
MMGKVVFPEMKRFNYDLKLGAGSIASGGLLGIMIPPSIIFILYASMAQISVADQLLAGVFPGILTILIFFLGISVICFINPKAGPPAPASSLKDSLTSLKKLWGAFVLIMIVIGGIYGGVFTPTEAAAIGAFFAFLFMIAMGKKQKLNLKESIKISALSMANTTSMIFALLVGAGIFSVFLSLARVPQLLSRTILETGLPPYAIVILILAIYIPIGMFLDTISGLIVTVPIVVPVIKTLGINLTWFGVLVCLMMEIALLTPPVGMNVYMVKATAPKEMSLSDVYKSIIPFLIMLLIVLTVLIIFPSISLWLPMHSQGG